MKPARGKPPLVLLHGFTGSAASWDAVIARLQPGPRIFTPTLTGHDPLDPDAGADGFDAEVQRIAALVAEHVADEPARLAGYSMGARVGLALLAERPDLFAGGLLIGVNPGLADESERVARQALEDAWLARLETGTVPFVDYWENLPLWNTQATVSPGALAAQRAIRLRHDARGLRRSLRALGLAAMPDLRARLARVRAHIDLMAGADDPKFVRLAEETAALLPDGRVLTVPDAGHNLLLERPRAVADVLNRKAS